MKQEMLTHFKNLFTSLLNDSLREEDLLKLTPAKVRGDMIDQAMNDREKQLILKLKGRQSFFIKNVEAALDKIDKGTFGICEDCGADIGPKRLLARPTATLCISCKEEEESKELHIPYQKRSHTHGKGLESKDGSVVEIQFSDKFKDAKQSLPEAGQHI